MSTEKKKFEPVLFIAEYRGYQPMDGLGKPKDKGIICRFTPFSIVHPDRGKISKGHYRCTRQDIYDRLMNFGKNPDMDMDDPENRGAYGKDYKIVKKLPRETDGSGMIIVRGVATVSPQYSMDDKQRDGLRELGRLQARHYTEGSGYKEFKVGTKKATREAVTREINQLTSELGI